MSNVKLLNLQKKTSFAHWVSYVRAICLREMSIVVR